MVWSPIFISLYIYLFQVVLYRVFVNKVTSCLQLRMRSRNAWQRKCVVLKLCELKETVFGVSRINVSLKMASDTCRSDRQRWSSDNLFVFQNNILQRAPLCKNFVISNLCRVIVCIPRTLVAFRKRLFTKITFGNFPSKGFTE